ncbi:beta-N-acetylhexosaminidase [Novispirillum itersonii subsp. nipponicum]
MVYGCAGPRLSVEEKRFFRDADPFGFILFARNVEDKDQLRRLTDDLRDSVGRADAPVLIDQEGGRVRRMRPPVWAEYPSMRPFGDLWRRDPAEAARLLRLNTLLLDADLRAVGISVNCTPVLDVPVEGAHDVIGNRAFSTDPACVAALGRVAYDACLEGQILPVIKHLPGHGRSHVDSHHTLPVVDTPLPELRGSDFLPFRDLKDAVFGMTAHIVFPSIDGDIPATQSATVIRDIIRGELGFTGILMTDDLSMKALKGDFTSRARIALDAGCDLVLHCNGDMAEMTAVAEGMRAMTAGCWSQWLAARALLPAAAPDFDVEEARREIARGLGLPLAAA